jgi:hypothetical protein
METVNRESGTTSTVENCALSNFPSKKQRTSKEAEAEERWRQEVWEKAPELYALVLEGEFQPKLKLGDLFIAKIAEVFALYPEHPKKAKQTWKSLFKNNDFPTRAKPLTYTTADRFKLIAECVFIRDPDNWPKIAELSWTTLYEMSKLTPEQFELGKSSKKKWTRKSINDLRNPAKRKGKGKGKGKGQGPGDGPDGRPPFPGGDDEPRERWDLTLTGSSPLHIGGEATANTLQYFRHQLKRAVKVATETRPDFKLATNTERSETTI